MPNPQPIDLRALVFDFDGLILDTETSCFASWQEVFRQHGETYALEDFLQIVGTHDSPLDPRRLLEKRLGRALDWDHIDAERLGQEHDRAGRLQPLPGVVALIEAARARGLKLAVVSSSSHRWVDGHLQRLGLFDAFATTVCRGDAPRVKPDPDLYLEAVRRLDVPPGGIVVFEDSHNGSLAAKRAGLWCVAVPSEITASQNFGHADLRVGSLADIDLDRLPAQLADAR